MRLLFATLPLDGHFNPLTGIAVHLREAGHEVRWYTGMAYAERLQRLAIPHVPFGRAREVTAGNIAELFPARARLRGPALIRFDFEQVFVSNAEAYFEDVRALDATWPFDVMFCDTGFLGARLVREVLGKTVGGVGVGTVLETAPEIPPNFLGMRPARSAAGRLAHRTMAAVMEWMVLRHGREIYAGVLAQHGTAPVDGSIYDEFYRSQDVVFQNGVPGFEYPRSVANPAIRWVGALLPARGAASGTVPRLADGSRPVVLVSQGTVDNRDPNKLIIPTLDALASTDATVVVATGHRNTAELRSAYPQHNVVIEDYVDFDAVLERADVFVCNGGYGSILQALSKGVPLITAGVREGKNDVNARVEHFGVGINLRTESPTPSAIRTAFERVRREPRWKEHATRLQDELATYQPHHVIDQWLAQVQAGSVGAHSATRNRSGATRPKVD